jgi:cyclohexanecarboxyl-CoA dehydrogenase
MAGLGLFGLLAPEHVGGQGADHVTLGIAAEEIGYADFTSTFFVLAATLASEALSRLDSEMGRQLTAQVLAGDAVVAIAMTEPGTGSDLAHVRTRADRVPGGWRISGEKSSISLAAAADFALVLAATDPSAGARGTGLFLLPLDDARVFRQTFDDPGFRSAGRGAISFDAVEIDDSHCLTSDGRGFHEVMRLFDFSRPFLGLACLGCAQASLDDAAGYAKVREAFGRPIGQYQGVAFPLAEHDTFVRSARWVCYEALWRRDMNLSHTREAAAAKWYGPRVAFEAAHDALLLMGNVGYTTESPFPQRMLDIMSCEIGDGTAQIQKAVIAREILGRDFKSY